MSPLKRVAIDFRPTRGREVSDLVAAVLAYYCGIGSKSRSASRLAVDAYRAYDASEPESITAIFDFRTRSRAFIEEFRIRSRNDIYTVVKNTPIDFELPAAEPTEKHMSFSEDDPDAMSLLDSLNAIRFRDRGIMLTKIIFQYLAHGYDPYYNKLSAYMLLKWLKEEYECSEGTGREKFEVIIDRICFDALKQEERDTDDLRRIIGVA